MSSTTRTVISQAMSLLVVVAGLTWWSTGTHPPVWASMALGVLGAVVALLLGAILGGTWNRRWKRY